jgi:hypothetical protein
MPVSNVLASAPSALIKYTTENMFLRVKCLSWCEPCQSGGQTANQWQARRTFAFPVPQHKAKELTHMIPAPSIFYTV